jgi:hypothetical protein
MRFLFYSIRCWVERGGAELGFSVRCARVDKSDIGHLSVSAVASFYGRYHEAVSVSRSDLDRRAWIGHSNRFCASFGRWAYLGASMGTCVGSLSVDADAPQHLRAWCCAGPMVVTACVLASRQAYMACLGLWACATDVYAPWLRYLGACAFVACAH